MLDEDSIFKSDLTFSTGEIMCFFPSWWYSSMPHAANLEKKRIDVSKSPKQKSNARDPCKTRGMGSLQRHQRISTDQKWTSSESNCLQYLGWFTGKWWNFRKKSIGDLEYRHEKSEFVEASQAWLKECGSFQILWIFVAHGNHICCSCKSQWYEVAVWSKRFHKLFVGHGCE